MKIKKRILSLALAGAMTLGLMPGMSATALASDGDTSYTLTIPSTLSVANSGWNATDGISATGSLEGGKKLAVTATSGDEFALVNGENKVGYKLATASTDTEATTSWEFTELTNTATTKPMGIVVEDYSTKPAGTYQDTVTFTAKVEDDAITLADAFENGSTTVVSFDTFISNSSCSITIANDNGNYSASGGGASGAVVAKTAVQDGEKLIVKFGFGNNDDFDGTITLDKSDNTYSINDAGYWDVYDLTSVVVNGTDVKSQLTKK